MGCVIVIEVSVQGVYIGYGLVFDLVCDLCWLCVEEIYGEDFYLNGVMGIVLVCGFQGEILNDGKSVIVIFKYFVLYGWMEGGYNGGIVYIGECELEEVIFFFFCEVVGVGVLFVMSLYNEIDGNLCIGSCYLLMDILKDCW